MKWTLENVLFFVFHCFQLFGYGFAVGQPEAVTLILAYFNDVNFYFNQHLDLCLRFQESSMVTCFYYKTIH